MAPFPLDDVSIITQSNDVSTICGVKAKKVKWYLIGPSDPRYDETLKQHNIAIKPYKDLIIGKLKKLILSGYPDQSGIVPTLNQEREEANWQVDRDNCARSNEAIFQRTMMMDMLNRHALDERTEFVREATWHSGRFSCSAEQCKISKPTPDLAVAFHSDSLLMDDEFSIA